MDVELDCEESWVPKNWCFWTIVLEKILESSLDCKEIQPVHPKGDQSSLLIGKTEGRRRSFKTEDVMVGWHHWLDEHEFEQAPGIGDGQGIPECYTPWGPRESYMTEQLNNSNCRPQGTPFNALWWPKWERNPTKVEYMYTYNWFILLYSRD